MSALAKDREAVDPNDIDAQIQACFEKVLGRLAVEAQKNPSGWGTLHTKLEKCREMYNKSTTRNNSEEGIAGPSPTTTPVGSLIDTTDPDIPVAELISQLQNLYPKPAQNDDELRDMVAAGVDVLGRMCAELEGVPPSRPKDAGAIDLKKALVDIVKTQSNRFSQWLERTGADEIECPKAEVQILLETISDTIGEGEST